MQNTDKKSFSFWKETFIQCTALEAFLLEVMRTNIKNKEKQKKNEDKCLFSCSGMSVWAPTILMVNTGKIFVGCQRQRNKSPELQSRDNFRTKQIRAELTQTLTKPLTHLCFSVWQSHRRDWQMQKLFARVWSETEQIMPELQLYQPNTQEIHEHNSSNSPKQWGRCDSPASSEHLLTIKLSVFERISGVKTSEHLQEQKKVTASGL